SVRPPSVRSFPTRRSSDLRWSRDGSGQSADICRNLGQVVIELMVAAFESADKGVRNGSRIQVYVREWRCVVRAAVIQIDWRRLRSEEHTSELQSPYDLVCR